MSTISWITTSIRNLNTQVRSRSRGRLMTVTQNPGRTIIRRHGILTDSGAVNQLADDVAAAVAGGSRQLIIDLTGVTRADSKITAALIAASVICRRCNVVLRVRPSAAVSTWLRLMNITGLVQE